MPVRVRSMAHCWVLRQQDRFPVPFFPPFGAGAVRGRIVVSVSRLLPVRPVSFPPGEGAVRAGGTGLLFGNCIVDASIFDRVPAFWCRALVWRGL